MDFFLQTDVKCSQYVNSFNLAYILFLSLSNGDIPAQWMIFKEPWMTEKIVLTNLVTLVWHH